VPLAGLVAGVIALPTAKVVFRLHGGYFAVGTWVVAEVYRLLIANASYLGGGSGKSLAAVRAFPKAVRESATYWIALAVAVGAIALVYLLLRSRHGLALTSIRDSERAAAVKASPWPEPRSGCTSSPPSDVASPARCIF
jgi:branched-chain amino acid transport system permease protein